MIFSAMAMAMSICRTLCVLVLRDAGGDSKLSKYSNIAFARHLWKSKTALNIGRALLCNNTRFQNSSIAKIHVNNIFVLGGLEK